jgi:hypothetical protein
MFAVDNVPVAGNGDKEIADLCGVFHRQHTHAVHNCFDSLDRIDLGNDDVCSHSASPHRDAFTTPSVTDNDQSFACKQNISRANYAVKR